MEAKFFAGVSLSLMALTVGCSGEDLRSFPRSARFATLDSMMDAAVLADVVPGGVVYIVQDGEILHYDAFGWSDPLDSIPMSEEAIFRICSQTKALTSTAAMILWERGLLDLDEPVFNYIPAFEGMAVLETVHPDSSHSTVPAREVMTVRHLMTHQSGIPYGEIGDPRFKTLYEKHGVVDLFTTDSITAAMNCERLAATALLHEPGAQWNYSLGLDVLVRVIEVASGEPFDIFLRREVLEPLGMKDTYFHLPDSLAGRLVEVWEPDVDQRWKPHAHSRYSTDYPVAGAQTYLSGGAGLCSTPADYARFLQMYLNRGVLDGRRILQESTVDSVMTNQELNPRDANWYQGLAFGVEKPNSNGPLPPGAFFWGGYFNTTYAADPQSQTIGILMKQTYGANDPTSAQFLSEVFGQLR